MYDRLWWFNFLFANNIVSTVMSAKKEPMIICGEFGELQWKAVFLLITTTCLASRWMSCDSEWLMFVRQPLINGLDQLTVIHIANYSSTSLRLSLYTRMPFLVVYIALKTHHVWKCLWLCVEKSDVFTELRKNWFSICER